MMLRAPAAAGPVAPAQRPGAAPALPGRRAAQRAGLQRPAALALEDAPVAASSAAAPPAVQLPPVDVSAVSQQAAESLQAVTGGVGQAAAGVGGKAAELASAASSATSQVTGAAGKAAAGLGAAVSGATSSVTSAVSGFTGGVTSGVSGLTSSLGQGASDVAGQVSGVAGAVGGSVSSTLAGVKGGLEQATAGVSGAVGGALDTVTATTSSASEAVSSSISAATAAVQQAVDSVSSQVTAVSSQVTASVDAATQQVLAALPPPAKDAALALGAGLAAVGHQAVEHPRAAAVIALAVGVPAAIRFYQGRYGGFAGEVSAEQVADLLTDDPNVLLVDVRPEAQREQEGLPQLKLGARFKVAAFVPQITIPSRVAREAVNADELRLLVNAAYIAGLPQVTGPLTKLVIMDSGGSDKARNLARALVSLGQPLAYVMTGGFKAWAAAELPVTEGASEYDASTGAVLSDEFEVIAGKAGEAIETVTQPQVGLPLLGGSAVAVYAALNIHTTLQYIGVLAVLLTIVRKAVSYSSPQEALDDAKGALGAAAGAASKLGATLGSLRAPSLPALPKLPGVPGAGAGAPRGLSPAAAISASRGDVGEETEEELID